MSTITELPTVNFDSYPGYDEFKFLHTTYSYEFKTRSSICSQPGIVDTGYDPATAPFSAGRPLLVTISAINSLTIDIAAGFAITPSNLLVAIDAIVPSVPMPSLAAGSTYIVAVEYTLVSSPQTRVNRFGDLTEVRLERPSNVPPGGGASTLISAITVANINDYNNPGIFDSDRLQNIVVIAIVNALSDPTTGQPYLSIDLTRNTYSFNRPWYTVRDVAHRTKIGSGLITDNNPHGTSLQDLSSAGLTLYQQLKPRGGIIAKDITYYGYAGKICSEEINLSRWEVDLTGQTTTLPGQPMIGGRYFVRLTKLPVRTGSLYFVGSPWLPIPYSWIPGTWIIVLGSLENPANYNGSLIMEYFTVDALEINAESPSQGLQTVEVKNPASSQEFIISGGLAISSLTSNSISLPSLLGPIKRGYQIICDTQGSLILHPQPILASVKVTDLIGTTQTVNQAPLNGSPVYLTVGLTRAIERTTINPTTTYDLNLQIRISGTDKNGTSINEVLTFTGSQWNDQSPTATQEQPLQFLRTANQYQLVTSISLANTTSTPPNAGPDALVSLWADILSGTGNQEFASVASFFWTGTTGTNVRDERLIATSFDKLDQKQKRFPTESPDADLSSVQELYSVLLDPPLTNPATPCHRLMLEQDDDRMWSETWKEFSTTWSSGQISLVDVTFVTMSQTIRLADGKYLKILPSSARPSYGEVNYSTSVDIFKNNMILTINDPVWNSTWFASLGSGANPPLVLTREDAYPDGFIINTRQKITFTSSFTTGSFSLTIQDDPLSPTWTQTITQSFTVDNNTTLLALASAITAVSSLTNGVTAVVVIPIDPLELYSSIILNGNQDGDVFYITDLTTHSSGAPSADLVPILDAFTVVQPTGGILPTPHLPQRYPTALSSWTYLSRPFLWNGVFMEANISVTSNDPTLIGNFDTIQIAPSKTIMARAGLGATADPTIGQFLVDPGSITNTMTNLAATVNHPVFSSGVLASVVAGGTTVRLQSAGTGIATLKLIASTNSNTWRLTHDLSGVTQYLPQGAGAGFAFLKSLKNLDHADWRYMTVEHLTDGWSPWQPMAMISPSAWKLESPAMTSLYQIQFRLLSPEVNSFSLYQYVPEVSNANLAAVEARLTLVEGEVVTLTSETNSLESRLDTIEPEVEMSHISVIKPDMVSLKEHLDSIDTSLYFTSFGGQTPHDVVTKFTQGMPQVLVSGPIDSNGNSKFILETGSSVLVGGSLSFPLLAQINGYTYRYTRQVTVDFSSQSDGLYYVYLEQSSPYGFSLASGTVPVTSGDMTVTDLSANFNLSGVLPGHLLYMSAITIAGQPLVMPITNVTATTLTLAGRLPTTLSPVNYTVYSPQEGTISFHSGSKITGTNRLYLGEVTKSGSSLTPISYRYLNRYTSPITLVDASGGSYTQTFSHNLGFYPSEFTIFFYEQVSGSYSGDPKILHIGDEAVVKTTPYVMTIKNRYANLVARTFDGTAEDVGYLQLII